MGKGVLKNLSGGQHGSTVYAGDVVDDTSKLSIPFANINIQKASGVTSIDDGNTCTYTQDARGTITAITDDGPPRPVPPV